MILDETNDPRLKSSYTNDSREEVYNQIILEEIVHKQNFYTTQCANKWFLIKCGFKWPQIKR